MKPIVITVLGQNHQRKDWFFDFGGAPFAAFVSGLTADLEPLGVAVRLVFNTDITITINSYADLLNCIKISSPQDNHHNHCVGHLIGKSERWISWRILHGLFAGSPLRRRPWPRMSSSEKHATIVAVDVRS